ncbi:hypothetical protein A1O7_07315 [Cladophialophora yegresii CBS 114405]|uniref:Zn(2)-C6 fungal-type domain-containing protein n=1 Tax=Cladophialophora yegresii CBS 114405 TaxID=1182544 RepID=W9VXL7_9EURO|nr:uncharacterized protein A1O7_07315 [Cladophialophora yegresii CBS 114405]EXJ56971.1 hypothetical protein A1O7_07315 [Cladophialophora yegresii CBS 114405]
MGPKKAMRRRTPASAPCPECGRAFSRNDSLSRHLKTHLNHAEQRPFHRIINEKFRACNRCRQSKTRCTGSTPCSRCEQLNEECSYDQSFAHGSLSAAISSTAESVSERLGMTTSPPSPPSHLSRKGDQMMDPAPQDDTESPRLEANEDTPLVVSSPKGTASMLHLALSSSPEAPLGSFNDGKDLSGIPSTYVSPTFHILDPYSYKLPSIADSREALTPSSQAFVLCKYPVLQYLSPFLDKEFGSGLACDLLDTYFSSAFLSRMHPTCHHIHNFILRKIDVLDPHQPRQTHPALLGSMLFVAAFSDKGLSLFNGPEEKDRVCKYLSLLTYRLLNPSRYEPLLRQEDLGLPLPFGSDSGWSNDDLRRALEMQVTALPISWGVDYIMALIHVSSVISGSEKKAASIRWWNVAFNLARDLKLNEEVKSPMMPHDAPHGLASLNCKCSLSQHSEGDFLNEAHREERRRTWWLLFLMDRHLALCYNRSLALLEAECRDLLLPLDDVTWQSGAQPHSHGTSPDGPRCMLLPSGKGRLRGPPKTCSGVGLFEFFLPLMVHCGTLLDLNRSRLHPVLSGATIWSSQEREILHELDQFQVTLDHVTGGPFMENAADKDNGWQPLTADADDSETTHIAMTVAGYATHIVNVLRILVGSKWDPIYLFEDADFWTSSLGFKDSMSRTMAASECVKGILECDPDISFMPYFFGIQLLHGSLLLLLVAYRLQADSGAAILAACEAVIRATEACFVTLPTDYQRQFRNVLRSATALARGRRSNPLDTQKQLTFVLARYRWSRNGAGLAR